MRILKNSNFDFMSKKIFALGLSGLIVFAGIFSLLINGGPKLSIDFKGGTLVAVQYNKEINRNFKRYRKQTEEVLQNVCEGRFP